LRIDCIDKQFARMAELADAADSKSGLKSFIYAGFWKSVAKVLQKFF